MSRRKRRTNLTQGDVSQILCQLKRRWEEKDPLMIELVDKIMKSETNRKKSNIAQIAEAIEDFLAKVLAEYFRTKS